MFFWNFFFLLLMKFYLKCFLIKFDLSFHHSPLVTAISKNNIEIVKLLLSCKNININIIDIFNN